MFDLKWFDKIRKYVELATAQTKFVRKHKNNSSLKEIEEIQIKLSEYTDDFIEYICDLYNIRYLIPSVTINSNGSN